jgi:exodeoxyribonuclease VII large subunit
MLEDRGLARVSTGSAANVLSVTQLNRSVRDMIEHRFPLLWVRGEVSNCMVARSGHVYFVLKDAHAQVRCVMFRSRAQLLEFDPCDGVEVEIQGMVTLYEPKGDFQLVVESMRRGGRGALFEAFLRVKEKLEREGLFDPESRKPLPYLPHTVGIVTSPQAAALRDVLTTLARRNPSIRVVLYPSLVQGDAAAGSIVRALKRAAARAECSVLLVCRGGGSMEDLWPFNEEAVARAIRACPMPVVTGIGHETDFTIADFAADQRAPTPTAAAELVSPERGELLEAARALAQRLTRRTLRDLEARMQATDQLARRVAHPAQRMADRTLVVSQLRARLLLATARCNDERAWRVSTLAQRSLALLPGIPQLQHRLRSSVERMASTLAGTLERHSACLNAMAGSLVHLSPERVLERGYSVVRDPGGSLISDASALSPGDVLELTFARGSTLARVEKTGPR